jgi:two-component system response regulator GlrR
MAENASVLIIDDDPFHLQIYGKIVERAGYRALTAEARFGGVKLPDEPVDIVLLDYHLAGLSAVEIAVEVQRRLPGVPILVLSDAFSLPEDIAPEVQGFVRKGDPAKLIATLHEFRSQFTNGSAPRRATETKEDALP